MEQELRLLALGLALRSFVSLMGEKEEAEPDGPAPFPIVLQGY